MRTYSTLTSYDGTSIAFEWFGSGPPVILVAGALQGRGTYRPLAEELSRQCTVFNYDRRGRGDSGDTAPYAVEREVEDIATLIAEAGGTASLYGHSSGAGLVLHAAEHGLPIDKIVLHEPPFGPETSEQRREEEEAAERFKTLVAQGRRREVVELFLAPMGLPPELVESLSADPGLLANAPTVLYDPFEVMSERGRGGKTPVEQASGVTTPALVLAGGASPPWMIEAGERIGEALPNGRFQLLDGQDHVVPPEVLVPVLAEFLSP